MVLRRRIQCALVASLALLACASEQGAVAGGTPGDDSVPLLPAPAASATGTATADSAVAPVAPDAGRLGTPPFPVLLENTLDTVYGRWNFTTPTGFSDQVAGANVPCWVVFYGYVPSDGSVAKLRARVTIGDPTTGICKDDSPVAVDAHWRDASKSALVLQDAAYTGTFGLSAAEMKVSATGALFSVGRPVFAELPTRHREAILVLTEGPALSFETMNLGLPPFVTRRYTTTYGPYTIDLKFAAGGPGYYGPDEPASLSGNDQGLSCARFAPAGTDAWNEKRCFASMDDTQLTVVDGAVLDERRRVHTQSHTNNEADAREMYQAMPGNEFIKYVTGAAGALWCRGGVSPMCIMESSQMEDAGYGVF